MLVSITIKNFRSHRNTRIKLSHGVNILVGRGQAGKSNIRRAIEWLCTNRPLGGKVHSWWCQKGDITSVTVVTDEGWEIGIKKPFGGGVEYHIMDHEFNREEFRKVGSSVPDRVVQELGITDLNIQGQLEQPYLVTDGVGAISRAVNQVVDLEVADEWLKEIGGRRHKNRVGINSMVRQRDAAKADLARYKGLPRANKALGAASRVWERLEGALVGAEAVMRRVVIAEKAAKIETIGMRGIKKAEGGIEVATTLATRLGRKRGELQVCKLAMEAEYLATEAKIEYEDMISKYTELLNEAGVCPVCYAGLDGATLKRVVNNLKLGG